MYKINKFLKNLTYFKFILIITLCTVATSAILGVIDYFFYIEPSANLVVSESNFISEFILVIIIAPLIETLIFQYSIIKFLRNFNILKNNNIIIILISSILFGLSHPYSLTYIINTTILGIFLSYSFVIYENKNESPFWVVCAIHSLKNFTSFVFIHFL
ncbi:CPBP family glutamic-type intramembrane protease [Clostridium sporogenes]|uniref:CPBP family glutamic-type intramembrane protease n=1 Tax=Clostridium sporogenes TaxID=1509 RepID=UPI0013D5F930|nr:CPBP family glutamic-type intramembrane protease [Clostridium sporogenes]NFP92699.1 CPBP family intramembrane metalloprotease [Clostridium sporogenes]